MMFEIEQQTEGLAGDSDATYEHVLFFGAPNLTKALINSVGILGLATGNGLVGTEIDPDGQPTADICTATPDGKIEMYRLTKVEKND